MCGVVFHFVQFLQFLVLDFGLVHYGSCVCAICVYDYAIRASGGPCLVVRTLFNLST